MTNRDKFLAILDDRIKHTKTNGAGYIALRVQFESLFPENKGPGVSYPDDDELDKLCAAAYAMKTIEQRIPIIKDGFQGYENVMNSAIEIANKYMENVLKKQHGQGKETEN